MTPFAASGQDGDEWPHGVGSEIDEEVLGLLDVTGVAEQVSGRRERAAP